MNISSIFPGAIRSVDPFQAFNRLGFQRPIANTESLFGKPAFGRDTVRFGPPTEFGKSPYEKTVGRPNIALDSRNFSVSRQTSELEIRTKDGDLVIIRLKAKEVNEEQLAVSVEKQKDSNGKNSLEIEEHDRSKEKSRLGLSAELLNGGVANLSVDQKQRSREVYQGSVDAEVDGVSVEADYKSVTRESSRLQIEVEGHLNDEELEAINQLVADVDDLAADFFDGDVQAAFAKGLELNYDRSQIAGYNLELKEKEVQVYQEQFEAYMGGPPRIDSVGRPLGEYGKDLQNVYSKAHLRIDSEMLDRIMEAVVRGREDDDDEAERSFNEWRDFNRRFEREFMEIER
ncbi:MAG: hypothetical protein MI748_13875 [Opitutales bacterium]|nr:hypothetical protein [Opitutales bacterium]